jgi:hypothetical protein
MTLWGTATIYHTPFENEELREVLAGIFAVATVLVFLVFPKRRRTLIVFQLSSLFASICTFRFPRRTARLAAGSCGYALQTSI